MNARSAPERVGQAHLADQLPNFERHLGPAGSSSRLPRIPPKQIDKLEHPAFFAQFGRSGQADGICGRDSCFQLYFGAQTPGNTGTFPHPCTVSEDRDWRAVRLSPNSETRWEHELPRIPGRWKLAEAIRYAMVRRAELDRFLDDGRLDIDTNTVERTIRPQTIIRKNALFAVLTAAGVVGRPSPRCSPPHGSMTSTRSLG